MRRLRIHNIRAVIFILHAIIKGVLWSKGINFGRVVELDKNKNYHSFFKHIY